MKEQRRTKGIRPGLCLLAVLLCFPGPLREEGISRAWGLLSSLGFLHR